MFGFLSKFACTGIVYTQEKEKFCRKRQICVWTFLVFINAIYYSLFYLNLFLVILQKCTNSFTIQDLKSIVPKNHKILAPTWYMPTMSSHNLCQFIRLICDYTDDVMKVSISHLFVVLSMCSHFVWVEFSSVHRIEMQGKERISSSKLLIFNLFLHVFSFNFLPFWNSANLHSVNWNWNFIITGFFLQKKKL